MKRQNIRKALILISFLLFPVTLYYLSPYLIVQAAAEGIIAGSFLVFTAMLVISLILGRAFCGWVCPAGGLQECCMPVSNKRAKGGKLNWIKYFIWVPWIILIGIMAIQAGGFHQVNFFYQTDHSVSVTTPQSYVIFYGVVILIVVLAFTAGRRSFCHYVCWMAPFMIIGSNIRNILRLPSLQLQSSENDCIHCMQCNKKCPMSLDVEQMVSKKDMRNAECILCGECIDTCPKKVIQYSMKHNK